MIMMTRSRSYIATPPGATIKEQLDDRGMSQKAINAKSVFSVIDKRRQAMLGINLLLASFSSWTTSKNFLRLITRSSTFSFLHGATFYDKNKIVVGLTLRGKDADKFWFSLFHEIGHILLGHLNQKVEINSDAEKASDASICDCDLLQSAFYTYSNRCLPINMNMLRLDSTWIKNIPRIGSLKIESQ